MQKPTIYRKPMGENLFEEEFTIETLSQIGNPLEQLASLVDFEMFRPALEDVLVKKECKTPAGSPQIDVVLMFKTIFLQRLGSMNSFCQMLNHFPVRCRYSSLAFRISVVHSSASASRSFA